jgi:NAD(P)-dependent dehydrogenase (short-subunit alcohol dehydrogenase family)
VESADLSDIASIPALVDRAAATLDGLDITLICQGVLPEPDRARRDPRFVDDVIRINFTSVAVCLEAAAAVHARAGAGCLVVLGSVAGDRGRASNYLYGATKSALETFTEGLRSRLVPAGIRVVLVKPGFVHSPMTAHLRRPAIASHPAAIAGSIHRAAVRGAPGVLYVPAIWRLVMLVIRLLPAPILRRLQL